MNKNPFDTSVSMNQVPDYILGIDENDTEYIIHLGSSYPCIIRINDIIDNGEEDEEVEDEDSDLLDEDIKSFVNPTFDIEIFKITEKGLKQIGYEKSLEPVKNIINLGLDFYISSNS